MTPDDLPPGFAPDPEPPQAADTLPPPVVPSFVTAATLMRDNPELREPVIDGLLRRGEVGTLCASPKLNKSWLLMHTALCVTQGEPILGFETHRGRVLLLDYELAKGTLAKRLSYVMSAVGLSPAAVGERLCVEALRGKRLDLAGLAGYFGALAPRQFDLIVVDPLYRVFGPDADENSNVFMANVFGSLQAFAEKLDAAILVCHHLSKGNQSDKSITDLGVGGGAQSRAADAHLGIRPHAEDGAAVIGGVVRSFPPFDPFAVRWQFPLWQPAPDLDPADLRKVKPTRAKAPAEPKPEPAPPMTPAQFVGRFVTADPQDKAVIVARAKRDDLSYREAADLLALAVADGLVYEWPAVRPRMPRYATAEPRLEPAPPDLKRHSYTHARTSPPYPPYGAEAPTGARDSARGCVTGGQT